LCNIENIFQSNILSLRLRTEKKNFHHKKMENLAILILVLIQKISEIKCDNFDVLIDAKAQKLHQIDSLNLLIYCKKNQFVMKILLLNRISFDLFR
jgi:hypothetical protein